ncbi:hypothetical protein BRC90_03500 [Halobacteriales archaeon QS_4_69_34]|nr:MAG: hypothetical protein BRC90_03500 [Halobacteriales archaeon QS_4_69_34]
MTVDYSVYIDATYQQGKYGEEGVARHGYAVDGENYTGDKLWVGGQLFEHTSAKAAREAAHEAVGTDAEGDAIEVSYDPDAPERAVIEPEGLRSVVLTLLVGAGLCTPTVAIVLF